MLLEVDFLRLKSLLIVPQKKNVKKKGWLQIDKVIFYKFKSKKISLNKHFYFRFGTKVLIFLFIDMERFDR